MRSAWTVLGLVLFMVLISGCRDLGVDPSGKLGCSVGQRQCPSGYECQSDDRCWRVGASMGDAAAGDGDSPSADAPSVDVAIDDHGAAVADGGGVLCSEGATRTCDRDGLLGRCATGSETCAGGRWGPCSIAPAAADRCDVAGDDSNCNGTTGDGCSCMNGATEACGPSADRGICKRGTQTCAGGAWGACQGGVFGKARDCTSPLDNDCDGVADNVIDSVCQCGPVNGSRACEPHPQDGVGPCRAGSQTCLGGPANATSSWGACVGSVGPAAADMCSPGDDSNCNGVKNEGCGGAKLTLTVKAGSALNFGTVTAGSSKMETFSLTNGGSMTSGTVAITLRGAGFSQASGGADDCVDGGTILMAGASCSITVRFSPSSGGTHQGTLSASASPGGTTDTLTLAADTPEYCGDGMVMGTEECDLGTSMNTGAYGGCTSTCKRGPSCGDGMVNGPEICDNGSNNALKLNACNPECSGTVGTRLLKVTPPVSSAFTTVAGADDICATNFGSSYRAVVVDGYNRGANASPDHAPTGAKQVNWVLKKYTLYRNDGNQDVFLTDGAALLGIRAGVHVDLINSIYGYSGGDKLDAWSGADRNWNLYDSCNGWSGAQEGEQTSWIALYVTSASQFPMSSGTYPCDAQAHLLCAQQ